MGCCSIRPLLYLLATTSEMLIVLKQAVRGESMGQIWINLISLIKLEELQQRFLF